MTSKLINKNYSPQKQLQIPHHTVVRRIAIYYFLAHFPEQIGVVLRLKYLVIGEIVDCAAELHVAVDEEGNEQGEVH